jgi:hypothetical protein
MKKLLAAVGIGAALIAGPLAVAGLAPAAPASADSGLTSTEKYLARSYSQFICLQLKIIDQGTYGDNLTVEGLTSALSNELWNENVPKIMAASVSTYCPQYKGMLS